MSEFDLFINSIESDSDEEIEKRFNVEFLEMKDKSSWSPLHHACFHGRVGLVKLLLSNHCKIDTKADRYPPIDWACDKRYMDFVDMNNFFILNKCDITKDCSSFCVCQPVHLAVEYGLFDIAKTLIESNCYNIPSNESGYQPIHLACEKGHIDIVKILIENKCDINASNKRGFQPIHFACEYGHIDIVEILIANNCVMNEMSKIALITKTMDLYCKEDCDHLFCRKSLEDETFRKGELIGSGVFTKVYKYKISNTNREIVIKRTKSICEDTKNIEENINKYSFRIVHKNIVRYFGGLVKFGKLSIYMEYMPGGSLKDLIDKSKQIENTKVIKFSKQILEALQFIHSNGIIHRDIKPENMLLDHDETLKLTDFGWSKSLRPVSIVEAITKTSTFCGTPNYLAPEVFMGEPYDFPADIWSTGASIIHMITGKIPYYWLLPEAVMFRIGTTKKIEIRDCPQISEKMQSFIDDLLTPEQSNRPSAEVLLKHNFFH